MKTLRTTFLTLIVLFALSLVGCATRTTEAPAPPRPPSQKKERVEATARGPASFYGNKWRGRTTASGEPFNPEAMTAAHRSYPFGTRVRVTNPLNGKTVVVRINDRGPYVKNRVIDLSLAAAKALELTHRGVGEVLLEVLSWGGRRP